MMEWEAMDSFSVCIGFVVISAAALILSQTRGFRDLLNYYNTYWRLVLTKKYNPKRLSNFKNYEIEEPKPEDIGLLPYPHEYGFENPKVPYDRKAFDGIHFCGVDSTGNFLDASITRTSVNQSSVWIIFKTANGSTYELPSHPDTRTAHLGRDQVYSSSCGLQIRCLCPLRRWRLSFNGLLRKNTRTPDGDQVSGELVHVKFSFIWISISLVHDFAREFLPSDVAKALVSNKVVEEKISSFQKVQNRYEQWGQLVGTAKVEGEEELELYLWSARTRILDLTLWKRDVRCVKLFIYFTDGTPLKIEATSINEFLLNYVCGYYIKGGDEKCGVTDFNLKLNDFDDGNLPRSIFLSFKKSGKTQKVAVKLNGEQTKLLIGPDDEREMLICPIKALMDGNDGYGAIHFMYRSQFEKLEPDDIPIVLLKDEGYEPTDDQLVLPLSDEQCKSSHIAGGKGCSLALLTSLSKDLPDEFSVPKGFAITTSAFKKHIEINRNLSDAVESLISVACGRKEGNLPAECERCSNVFVSTNLSDYLQQCVLEQMYLVFGEEKAVKVAVRSSAYGEDSEDMSAAGQMVTLLGVQGLANICDAITKCWSSHFRFEAVQYSRQNGFPIDSPMAVVVQEMVSSEVAGVMFTIDPVTGNPAYPCITANFGLGETVVSSAVEPDTITLKRDKNHEILVFKKEIGSKNIQVILKDSGGVEEKSMENQSNDTCLTDDWAVKIGNVGLLIEQSYSHPCDIEWAICNRQLFLLQSRPITTIHRETEFELIHELDTATRSSYEYWTNANTGEVFPGAVSPLGISLIVNAMDFYGQKDMIKRERPDGFVFCPYRLHWLPTTHRHVTLSIIDALFRANDRTLNATQKSFEVSLFGRELGSDEMHKIGVKRYGYVPRSKKIKSVLKILYFSCILPNMLERMKKRVDAFSLPVESWSTSTEVFQNIIKLLNFFGELSRLHGLATFLSSIHNVTILSLLSRGKEEWDNELYGDFAALLSTCTDVISADVPSSLQELAKAIAESDPLTFAAVPPEVAYSLLKNDTGVPGTKFKEFLQKHGHRCVKEFDVYSISWGMEPVKLVQILQSMVRSPGILKSKPKEPTSIDTAIKKLKTNMSTSSLYFLKFILPRCRNSVGYRETTKSLVIKIVDWMKKSCRRLGHLMVSEGLLPEEELVFFLTFDEIQLVVNGIQNLGLVSRAIRRRRVHPKLDLLKFPEIMHGVPKPIVDEPIDVSKMAAFVLKGTPVCQGVITARARVVLNLSEASSIQGGDILVAHSTDIGWSPYFPLLSGVITVLGGLISHGAVVAREYGLPCVVGVQKATSIIKSGDLIVLDGIKGTITRIEEKEEENPNV